MSSLRNATKMKIWEVQDMGMIHFLMLIRDYKGKGVEAPFFTFKIKELLNV
jgi:hypothetical protein